MENKRKEIYSVNKESIFNTDFNILDEKYLNTLGKEKINLIINYPNFQNRIIGLDDKKYQVFSNCLNQYLTTNETENWTEIATILLQNIDSGEYDELISNIKIDEVDIDKLEKILQNKNDFQLKNSSDLTNYEIIKTKKLDNIIRNSEDIDEIKEAVFLKIFGQSKEYSDEIIKLFGEDIQNLHDCDEKDFIICLKEIMKLNDIEVLKKIYANCEEVGLIDKTYMVQSIKREYFKEYKETLYLPYEKKSTEKNPINTNDSLEKEFEGLEVYDAGTDFCMLVSKVRYEEEFTNLKNSWYRPNNISQHFCASYIRNDMIGIFSFGPSKQICYGFYNLDEDSLVKSGPKDICSERGWDDPVPIVTSLNKEKYYTPNSQINQTKDYNEMDIFREKEGEKIKPDYIVAFRKNGKIDNKKEILCAYNDWEGELPIVIVDIDRCLEIEKQDIEKMFTEYNETNDKDVAESTCQRIIQKINNNLQTIQNQGIEDDSIKKFLDDKYRTLYGDKAIQRDFGFRRQEIEKILKVKINSLYYGNILRR